MIQKSQSLLLLELASVLRAAKSVAVLTGAGVSAESGLPTFRDAMTGLWAEYRPEDLATPKAFRRNPKLVWDWYAWRRNLAKAALPNAAHHALASMQRLAPNFTLITQNVDGLHRRAGSSSAIELHGSLFRARCVNDGSVQTEWDESENGLPLCARCGGPLRPDIVWFGEALSQTDLQAAIEAAARCDLFLSIGTSGSVDPAASLLHVAERVGASCAIINVERVSNAPESVPRISGPAGEIVLSLVRAAWPDTGVPK